MRGRWLAALVVVVVRAWLATLRVRRRGPPFTGPGVVAFWHGDQLPLLAIRPPQAVAPMSLSADGRLQARVMAAFGIGDVPGSSSRGGLLAAKGLYRAVRQGQIALVAVDGPRGPVYEAKPGAAWLAQRAGVPLWPVAVAARGWRLRAWDRFLLPYPFSRVDVVVGEPLRLDDGAELAELAAQTGAGIVAAGALARAPVAGLPENRVDGH